MQSNSRTLEDVLKSLLKYRKLIFWFCVITFVVAAIISLFITNRFMAVTSFYPASEDLSRPDAGFVREVTGFAIGGVPPFGHPQKIATFVDNDLLVHDVVWAAGGTPSAVFSVEPNALAGAVDARTIAVA